MYFFRADGSAAAGAGHLMRCLTVAQELQKLIAHPEEVWFLCAEEASAELLRRRAHLRHAENLIPRRHFFEGVLARKLLFPVLRFLDIE